MASSGFFSGIHLKQQQKEDRKRIWIRGIREERVERVEGVEEVEGGFAFFKLNPVDPRLSGSRVPVAPLPKMHHRVPDGAALAISGSRFYVLGGFCPGDCRITFNHGHKDVYSIKLKGTKSKRSSWRMVRSMLSPRIMPTCVVVDGKIYVFGGLVYAGNRAGLPFGEVFDPTRNKWEALPQIPTGLVGNRDPSRSLTVNAAAATVAGGDGSRRYILVNLPGRHSLLGYCLEDKSWFCVDPEFDPFCRHMVLVDDVIYSVSESTVVARDSVLIFAYHLPTMRVLEVHGGEVKAHIWSKLIYVGNNKFWLFYSGGSPPSCRFVEFEVRKNWKGRELDSISITRVSSAEFSLDALDFDGIMAT